MYTTCINTYFISLHAGKGEIEKANLQRFYCTFLDANCEEAKQAVIDAIYDSLTSVSCPHYY